MKRPQTKNGVLAVAIIWTAVTAMWIVTCLGRYHTRYGGMGLFVLTLLTACVSAAAAAANWMRWKNFKQQSFD